MSADDLREQIIHTLAEAHHPEDQTGPNGHDYADALAPLIRQAQAKALRDFADSTRFPNHWILFRRDDGSGVTVADLLRETADRIEDQELLCDLTGGKLSYPTYDVQTMVTEIEEHVSKYAAADVAERIAQALQRKARDAERDWETGDIDTPERWAALCDAARVARDHGGEQ